MKNDALEALKMTVIGLLLIAAVAGSALAWRYFMAEPAGRASAEWQIESAGSRITSYNHYFDLCAAIQGYEGALISQQALLEVSPPADESRVLANIAGISAQRLRAIAQYNADANKAYTTARFLGAELPRRIDPKQGVTQCAN